MAKLPTGLQPSLNTARAQRRQARVALAHGGLGAFFGGHFDNEGASLDGVDEDETRGELGVGVPGAEESDGAAAFVLVIFRVDVEEAGFADGAAGGVFSDGASVPDVEAVAVVGLVEVAVYHVLIVIDGASSAGEVAAVEGIFEIADVEDVCRWETLGHGAYVGVSLVEFVVEEEIFLPSAVVDSALMGVLNAGVSGLADDCGLVASFVGDIVNSEGVLVVSWVTSQQPSQFRSRSFVPHHNRYPDHNTSHLVHGKPHIQHHARTHPQPHTQDW